MRWLFTSFYEGHTSLTRRTVALTVGMTVYCSVVAAVDHLYLGDLIRIQPNLHALLGTVLGVLLVFRTNTAYDRWWEGRKLWGQLVNDSRNLAIKVRALPKVDRTEKYRMARLLVNFARALKEHLREGIRPANLSIYRGMASNPTHVPAHVAGMIRETFTGWKAEGRIEGFDDLLLDPHARALLDICGACERIRKTPIARSYLLFIRQSIALYLLTLPWGLVDDWGYWCIPVSAIITYFLLGMELLAEEVEEPFGHGEDDLVLDEICQGIEATVMEILTLPSEDGAARPVLVARQGQPVQPGE